jgi:hypothetical protein
MKSNSRTPAWNGCGETRRAVAPTPSGEIRRRQLVKAGAVERLTDEGREVGRMTVARPDDRGVRSAELREMVDRVGDVDLADVAEHATEQDQVGRDGAPVCVGDGGIAEDRLDAMKARCLRGLPRKQHVALVQLQEPSCDILAAGMVGQCSDQVVGLAGADPDRSNRIERRAIEHGANLRLNDHQPAAKGGVRSA